MTKIITDGKALTRKITSISGRETKLSADIDQALRSAIYHRFEHGDNTKLTKLYNGLGRSVRKADIMSYIVKYAGVQYVKKDKAFKNVKTDNPLSLDQCENLPAFWNLIKDTGNPAFKADAYVKGTLSRIRALVKDGKLDASDIANLKIGLESL